jgi:hypothetical protein
MSGAIGIERRILVLRDQFVMLDSDLAALYDASTRQLNQQVKRNRWRFPEDFMFRLTEQEHRQVTGISTENHGGRRHRPYAFTEQGAGMLSSVLRTTAAARASVEILRAFRRLRSQDGPEPDALEERKIHGVFAAIRDAVLLHRGDASFTSGEPYTYFIQAGEDGPIKIGWTRNLLVRLRSFAAMFPMPLRLLGVIQGDVEDLCHKQFAASRVGGEWFDPTPVLLEFIRERAKIPAEPGGWFGRNSSAKRRIGFRPVPDGDR